MFFLAVFSSPLHLLPFVFFFFPRFCFVEPCVLFLIPAILAGRPSGFCCLRSFGVPCTHTTYGISCWLHCPKKDNSNKSGKDCCQAHQNTERPRIGIGRAGSPQAQSLHLDEGRTDRTTLQSGSWKDTLNDSPIPLRTQLVTKPSSGIHTPRKQIKMRSL